VARVQALIRYHTHKGYLAVIVGEPDHPEVIGLKGHGNGRAFVISTSEEVSLLPEGEKILVVAQTTQEKQTYERIVEAIKKRFPEALVFNTICDATEGRQQEVRALATHVDGIVVVGGFHSGNTRRLAQVASSTGLPVFHVETDQQLDREKLSAMEIIGVTAGASTPNWMINKVVQKIESIRSRKETALDRFLRYAVKFIFQSNIVAAFGAFSLAHAMNVLSGRPPDLILPSLAFLYIYAMHVLNRLLDKGASTYNDPERAAFYRRYRGPLVLSGLVAIAGALVLSAFLGLSAFVATAGLSLLGSIYSLPIVPLRRRHLWRYSKIKDIPGSKTFAQAFAWGAVIALLPFLGTPQGPWTGEIVSFVFVFSVVYVRSAFFDIFQVQGDLIVGAETLPITLGEKRTLWLLRWVMLVGSVLLTVAPLFGWTGPFAYPLLLCYLTLTLCILAYEKGFLYPGNRSEAFVEANLFLAGFLALLWQWLQ
jgi:4-hydroxy-3-methylbut-2-enyl diphosphate reductase